MGTDSPWQIVNSGGKMAEAKLKNLEEEEELLPPHHLLQAHLIFQYYKGKI